MVARSNRYVYQRLVRPVGRRVYLCHTCDVPRCVNPAHLYEGNASTNGRDAHARGLYGRRTRRPNPLTND